MTDRLLVLLSGVEIGALERNGTEDATFVYLPEYVATGEVALSAMLPIQAAPHHASRVRPFLAGLLPESIDARRAWASQLGVDAEDAFGLLAQMGWDCPGAVQFCHEEDLAQLRRRGQEFAATNAVEIGARIRALVAGEPSWTMQAEHWSLGGQQQKFALSWHADAWHTAHGSAPTTHIIKPGIGHLRHQALLEHLTMSAASILDVDVAATEFARFDQEWAIVIERFDRTTLGTDIVRIHQEDFAQACGRMPARKYESQDGPRLVDMMRIISRESTDLHEDRRAVLDMLAFNLVVGAPDGHAKNVALLRPHGAVHVAPLFDLATGLAYDTATVDRSVALSIGGERIASRIHRRQWERASSALGLGSDAVLARVAALAEGAPAAFERALGSLPPGTPGADDVAERLLPSVARHTAAVLERL